MEASNSRAILSFKNMRKGSSSSSSEQIGSKNGAEQQEEEDVSDNRTETIFKSIKQKLLFGKTKLSFCKQKTKPKNSSVVESFLWNNREKESYDDDTPPAVPPRPLFTFEEGQYIDIPRTSLLTESRQQRIITSSSSSSSQCLNANANTITQNESVISESPQKSFQDAMSCLCKYGWYWGPLSRKEAEQKLESQPDGAFLVRNSYSNDYFFTVSFRSWGLTMHTRIDYKNGQYTIMDQQGHNSVGSLIEEGMKKSKTQIYCYSRPRDSTEPSYAVRLTKPISRHTQLRDLQYLCRFVIRQYISVSNIQKLPIPEPIQQYLSQSQF